MNKSIISGRLTADPEIRYTGQGDAAKAVAHFTLAVRRKFVSQEEGAQTSDFIQCVAFGKNAEFFEKHAKKGMKFEISGRIQTGSYTNKDGNKVYTTELVVEEQEFAEKKADSPAQQQAPQQTAPQQQAPQQTAPQMQAPQQMVPQQMAPQQMAPQQMAPQQMAPQQMAPQQMAPQQMAPQQMAPQQMAPQQMAPQQMAPQMPVDTSLGFV